MTWERRLDCPCICKERSQCRGNCWHFGNQHQDCKMCHNTGYQVLERARGTSASEEVSR